MENFKPTIVSRVPKQKEIQFLDDRIYEHNSASIARDDGKLFYKSILDSEGNVVAGITGWTWANACEVTFFWVRHDYRNRGYGKLLLHAVETEAKKEKCKSIFLRTYSFQAPDFYRKYGYQVEHEMKDFPPGHSSFCLMKKLE